MNREIMTDIESLSTSQTNAVIVSIAAVASDGTALIVYPSIEDQVKMGREVSADTLAFWLAQESKVRIPFAVATSNSTGVLAAMTALSDFIGKDDRVYGYGASFDNSNINSLMEASIGRSIYYKNSLCYRTLAKFVKPRYDSSVNKNLHDPFYDALHQLNHLMELLNTLGAYSHAEVREVFRKIKKLEKQYKYKGSRNAKDAIRHFSISEGETNQQVQDTSQG